MFVINRVKIPTSSLARTSTKSVVFYIRLIFIMLLYIIYKFLCNLLQFLEIIYVSVGIIWNFICFLDQVYKNIHVLEKKIS